MKRNAEISCLGRITTEARLCQSRLHDKENRSREDLRVDKIEQKLSLYSSALATNTATIGIMIATESFAVVLTTGVAPDESEG